MMNWDRLLSLKRYGDTAKRWRKDQDETRIGFEVDYDRIVFSSAFRSLQDKTQVFPLSEASFVHTRLTHSLEVSVVGRSLGRMVGKFLLKKYPHIHEAGYKVNDFGAIIAAACLMHDIGNPPFGHPGEQAIGDYFRLGKGKNYQSELTPLQYADLTYFEGNANGLKIINQTGLRLSYATLGAFMKYPKAALPHKVSDKIAYKKYGYFQSEADLFQDLAQDLGLLATTVDGYTCYERHPLAFLVEAADDICYTIIDLEDGVNLGLVEEQVAFDFLQPLVEKNLNKAKFEQLSTQKERVAYLRALSINTLITDAADLFMQYELQLLTGTFETALLDKSQYRDTIQQIIALSEQNIYHSDEVVQKEISGYQLLHTLLDAYGTAADNYHKNSLTNYDKLILKWDGVHFDYVNTDLYARLISISSYVASLTDGETLRKYKIMKGIDL